MTTVIFSLFSFLLPAILRLPGAQVMSQYGLGPNGAITTSLNLFATRFDQVLDLLEKRSDELE